MDYMIADAVVVPPGADSIFSEAVVRLSRCYQPADRKLEIASETPTRAAEGLPPDGTVFCCFNNGFKLGPEIFALWLRLLAAVPKSVLWLLESNSVMPGRLRKIASEAAIAPGRLIFAPRRDRPHHLARQRLADLFLDTTPSAPVRPGDYVPGACLRQPRRCQPAAPSWLARTDRPRLGAL